MRAPDGPDRDKNDRGRAIKLDHGVGSAVRMELLDRFVLLLDSWSNNIAVSPMMIRLFWASCKRERQLVPPARLL